MKKLKHTTTKYLLLILFILQAAACQNSEELALKGMEALNEGKKVTALRFFEEALRKDKKQPLSLFGKGKILLDSPYTYRLGQQMIHESLDSLEPPYKETAYLALADSYSRSNQYQRAIEVLKKAEEKKMKSQLICSRQVYYKMQMRQFKSAQKKVDSCLEKFPGNTRLQLLAGVLEAKRRRYAAAIMILEKAHQGAPDNKEVIKKLAIIHYLKREIPKSVNYLKLLKSKQVAPEQKEKINSWIKQANQKRWEVSI